MEILLLVIIALALIAVVFTLIKQKDGTLIKTGDISIKLFDFSKRNDKPPN